MKSICVDPAQVHKIWPTYRPWVKRAVDKGYSDFEHIEKDVLEGRSLLWLAYGNEKVHAVAVTAIIKDACEIITCTGDGLDQFLPLLKELECFAANENCERMRIIGREGWKRALPDYRVKSIVLEKTL